MIPETLQSTSAFAGTYFLAKAKSMADRSLRHCRLAQESWKRAVLTIHRIPFLSNMVSPTSE
jgi:hypothetical protein